MAENRSSISNENSYQKIGDHWDSHDLTERWDKTTEVEFDIDLGTDTYYYPVETALSSKIHSIAEEKGVSTETLVNLWLRERLMEESGK